MTELSHTCAITNRSFEYSEAELQAYRKFGLPLPSVCPEERLRRRLIFRSGSFLRKINCAKSNRETSSYRSAIDRFSVYHWEEWADRTWGSVKIQNQESQTVEQGIEFNFSAPFFNQLYQLYCSVPHPSAILRDASDCYAVDHCSNVTRSSFVRYGRNLTSCYHSLFLDSCVECASSIFLSNSRECFHSVNCHSSERVHWSEHSDHCSDSWFISNCVRCKNCLFCDGLSDKEYCVFNEEVGPEKFREQLAQWDFADSDVVETAKNTFAKFLQYLGPSASEVMALPEYFRGCQDGLGLFCCLDSSEVTRGEILAGASCCLEGFGAFGDAANCAQFIGVGANARNLTNCIDCFGDVSDLDYCIYCEESSNLFCCVGLKGKEYCILNKQYSKSEYFSMKAKIEDYMREKKVLGMFFPIAFSPYYYNHSLAHELMPMNQGQARMMKFLWSDQREDPTPSELLADGMTSDKELAATPLRFSEVDFDQLSSQVFICELSGKPYQVMRDEAKLLAKLAVPFPKRGSRSRLAECLQKVKESMLE